MAVKRFVADSDITAVHDRHTGLFASFNHALWMEHAVELLNADHAKVSQIKHWQPRAYWTRNS